MPLPGGLKVALDVAEDEVRRSRKECALKINPAIYFQAAKLGQGAAILEARIRTFEIVADGHNIKIRAAAEARLIQDQAPAHAHARSIEAFVESGAFEHTIVPDVPIELIGA